MSLTGWTGLLCASACAYIVSRKLRFYKRSRGYQLPPSRPSHFFLGHALEIPIENEPIVYQQWCKELGSDIIYVNAAGTPIVILNTFELANELLDGRSTIHSSRWDTFAHSMGWGWALAGLPYGQEWKDKRKLLQKHLHPSDRSMHQPFEHEQVHNLLKKLLDAPQGFLHHIRHMVGGLSLAIAYGRSVKMYNDPAVDVAESAIKAAAEAGVPGAFFVDLIPLLRYVPEWLPGAGFKRKARGWRLLMEEMRDRPFDELESKIASGEPQRPSFAIKALQNIDVSENVPLQRERIRDTAGMVFTAAADTTTSAIQTFFAAMLCFPQVQRRAKEEIDRVLGGRLPEAKDQSDLPYVTAIATEVLRFVKVYIGAYMCRVPHMSTSDDIFKGYFIPKGTIVVANAWAMLRNEEDYPNPDVFSPERYLKDGTLNSSVPDPGTIVFGFGRRSCPGEHIARSVLWLTIASVLSAFDISKPLDEHGKPVDVKVEYGSGIVSHPLPFKCTITPRSPKTAETIRNIEAS
ncbi:cytochrome P450 [Coprinopsis marcescibilis]|uniref:Cytochrome P450 n=1 Tax=Coprinopsis marcescibilis TaxID=230819 RepID=A0A5C3L6U6_COPMA|nr:cytochrome P450 [Coprinopsis marcescibilis]